MRTELWRCLNLSFRFHLPYNSCVNVQNRTSIVSLCLIIDPRGTHTYKKRKHVVMQHLMEKQNCRHFPCFIIFVESLSQGRPEMDSSQNGTNSVFTGRKNFQLVHLVKKNHWNTSLNYIKTTFIFTFSMSSDRNKVLKEVARKQSMKAMTALYFLLWVRQQCPTSCHCWSSFLLWCRRHT